MFGILVVQLEDDTYGYLGTVSGKLPGKAICLRFVPSIFDDSIDDFFVNRGMAELKAMGKKIEVTNHPLVSLSLKEDRKDKSIALQLRLFENYNIKNLSGKVQNLLQIFRNALDKNPPSAAGECAAPKLLQYAIEHRLKPIALTEFWWGGSVKFTERTHKAFYPACKKKCQPILEYMLEDNSLFGKANDPTREDE